MKFSDAIPTLRIATGALLRNRSRSLLTMLGVVIGVAAVIVTVAIGAGARTSVADQINGLGSNMVDRPARQPQPGRNPHRNSGGASTLTPDDGLALAQLPARRGRFAGRHGARASRRGCQQLADDDFRRRADLHVRS